MEDYLLPIVFVAFGSIVPMYIPNCVPCILIKKLSNGKKAHQPRRATVLSRAQTKGSN